MRIFISYRRLDSQYVAGRLDDFLSAHFGRENVFFDARTIEAGSSFPEAISKAIADSDVVLPIVGPGWSGRSADGAPGRIDAPDDFIRIELETALALSKRIVPVFLSTVSGWPAALPPSIAPVAALHGLTLRPGRDFRDDAMSLMRELGKGQAGAGGLLGRWHCVWQEVREGAPIESTADHVWATEDVVEIFDVVGSRLYARGLNYKQGGFELEGWWSDVSVSFVFAGVGRDAPLKGTVSLRRVPGDDSLSGLWTQYTRSDERVIGGPTTWTRMEF